MTIIAIRFSLPWSLFPATYVESKSPADYGRSLRLVFRTPVEFRDARLLHMHRRRCRRCLSFEFLSLLLLSIHLQTRVRILYPAVLCEFFTVRDGQCYGGRCSCERTNQGFSYHSWKTEIRTGNVTACTDVAKIAKCHWVGCLAHDCGSSNRRCHCRQRRIHHF